MKIGNAKEKFSGIQIRIIDPHAIEIGTIIDHWHDVIIAVTI